MAQKVGNKSILSLLTLLVVGLALSPLLISLVNSAQPYDSTTYQLVNYEFSDNTGDVPDSWENFIQGNVVVNAWNASGYTTVTRTDNGDNYENGIWYQRLSLPSLHDEIYTATIDFKYRVIDNENAGSIVVKVLMDSGDETENFVLIDENVTESESGSWTSVENNVIDNIAAVGTYTLWFRVEINPVHTNAGANPLDGSSIIIGWDDANLTIVGRTQTNTTMMIFANLIPLFFIIGLVLTVIYWATGKG